MNTFRWAFERHLQFAFRRTNINENQLKLMQVHKSPLLYQSPEPSERKIIHNTVLQKTPWQLPSKQKAMVFTFPSAKQQYISAPGLFINEFMKKFDPLPFLQIPLQLPQQSPIFEIFAGERMLQIRRHKMLKHKRRKRYDRDYFKYQKYHRQKKAKAEILFRERMNKMIEEYKAFDPEKYIKDVIARAKQDVIKDVSPSGRRKYPHWSTLVTLEELYGIPPSSYIDKRAGLAGDEDREKISQLKKEYDEKYRGFLTRTSHLEEQQDKHDSVDKRMMHERIADSCENSKKTEVDKAESDDSVKSQ